MRSSRAKLNERTYPYSFLLRAAKVFRVRSTERIMKIASERASQAQHA